MTEIDARAYRAEIDRLRAKLDRVRALTQDTDGHDLPGECEVPVGEFQAALAASSKEAVR